MLPKFRSFNHSIVHRSFIVPIHCSSFVHSPYSSFFHIIFVLPLCCRNSDRSFDHSIVRSFVQIIFFLSLWCRNSDRSFVRSFDRSSFVLVPIHRSSFVHRHYSSFIVRSYELFTITIHHYYSLLLFTDTIHHRYYSSMISIITFSLSLFTS
jgi:hypothetical protein